MGIGYCDNLNSPATDQSWNIEKFTSTNNDTTTAMTSASDSTAVAVAGGAVGVNAKNGVFYGGGGR